MSQSPSVSATSSRIVPPSPFECSWKSDGFESAWVHLGGELDLAINARGLARREGKGLTLVRCSGQVDRVLGLTGLLEQDEVVDLHLAPAQSDEVRR